MPDYLSTKDWRSVLDAKEHKSVKKTGVSETLDDYASAKKKDEIGKMVSALQRIIEKAEEVKGKQDKFPKLVDFLTNTIRSAKAEQQKLGPRLAEMAEGEDEDNEDNTLGKALTKVRQLGPENAWNFILAPGKPSSGLVVKKKTPRKADIELAFELKGKRGPFFMGRIYGEAGKFVLETEAAPVPGMAKAAKNGALLHAEMNIKVLVRGGGVELDSDTDIEPIEEGEGPMGPKPETNQGHIKAFEDRLEKLTGVVNRFAQAPNRTTEGAADGILGAIRVLLDQIANDTQLTQNMKEHFRLLFEGLRITVNEATKPPEKDPARDYPELVYWQRLADGIVRLDPEKRRQGWLTYLAKLKEVREKFDVDEALAGTPRDRVGTILVQAENLAKNAQVRSEVLGEAGETGKDPELTKRMLAMERQYDLIRTTPGLDPERVRLASNGFVQLRSLFAVGKVEQSNPAVGRLELALGQLAEQARVRKRETSQSEGQNQMNATLKPSMEMLKKASVPTNLIKDPGLIREAVKTNPDLRGMLETMSAAAKAPGMDTGRAMELAARKLMEAVAARREFKVPPTREEAELEDLATAVLQRAKMMQMAAEYAQLGDPPWTPEKMDIASELQAQVFFIEGAFAQGTPHYKAPDLGAGQTGASGSWWIERTEANKGDGRQPATKKQYIFKPGRKEAAVMIGLPPGSGAPREVLAKRLDETMRGAGFDVGVSPTTLASIDSAQLGNTDPKGGPMLGSMQQLAPSDGSLKPKLEAGKLAEFSKTLDKKSFDDVAVFDMIFANLDRHADNILIQTDPVTGTSKLLPIDHGSSLPDPEALQANARSLCYPPNIMACPDIEQSQQVLGPDSLQSLLRLDADAMVNDMKQARNDMARRHKDTDGTISDEAIEAMGARVRFVQAAAPTVPVGLLFQMLAQGALRIAKAKPEDIPALIETLRAEVEETARDKSEINEGIEGFKATGDGASNTSMIRELGALGWGWNVTGQDWDHWISINAKLVSRILKTRMFNPALQNEIDRLLPLAKANDPQIEVKIRTYDPAGKYSLLFTEAHKHLDKGPSVDTPMEALREEFDRLGGLDALQTAARSFPADVAPCLPEPAGNNEDVITKGWIKRVSALRKWAALQAKGGVARLLELSPGMPREMPILTAMRTIDEKSLSGAAINELMDLDEEEIEQRTAAQFVGLQNDLRELMDTLREPSELRRITTLREQAIALWTQGKPTGAITLLGKAKRLAVVQLPKEREYLEKIETQKTRMRETLDTADESIANALTPHLERLLQMLDEGAEVCSPVMPNRVEREFKNRIEVAEKGEESAFRKVELAVQGVVDRANGHARMVWQPELGNKLDALRDRLTIFDVSNAESGVRGCTELLNALDMMKDALGQADLGTLPEPVMTILNGWKPRIANNDRLQLAKQEAEQVRTLLLEGTI